MLPKALIDALERTDFDPRLIPTLDVFLGVYEGKNLLEHFNDFLEGKTDTLKLIDQWMVRAIELWDQMAPEDRSAQMIMLQLMREFMELLAHHVPDEQLFSVLQSPVDQIEFLQYKQKTSNQAIHQYLQAFEQNIHNHLQRLCVVPRLKKIIVSCDDLDAVKSQRSTLAALREDPIFIFNLRSGTNKKEISNDQKQDIIPSRNLITGVEMLESLSRTLETPGNSLDELFSCSLLYQAANPTLKNHLLQKIEHQIEKNHDHPEIYASTLLTQELLTRLSTPSAVTLLQSMPQYFKLSHSKKALADNISPVLQAFHQKQIMNIELEKIQLKGAPKAELISFLCLAQLPHIQTIKTHLSPSHSCLTLSKRVELCVRQSEIPDLICLMTYSSKPIQCSIFASHLDEPQNQPHLAINQALSEHGFNAHRCKERETTVQTSAPTRNFLSRKQGSEEAQPLIPPSASKKKW
jgi:hypothetical protein